MSGHCQPPLLLLCFTYAWPGSADLAVPARRALRERAEGDEGFEENTTWHIVTHVDPLASSERYGTASLLALFVVLLLLAAASTLAGRVCKTRGGGCGSDASDLDESDSDTSAEDHSDLTLKSTESSELVGGEDHSDLTLKSTESSELVGGEELYRQWPVRLCIVLVFVLAGSAHALAVAAAKGPNSKLPFDFAVAVVCTDAMKLMVAVGWLFGMGCPSLAWPLPRSWLWETADLTVVAALFAVQDELHYVVITLIGPLLFTILGNLKIVFTVIFMKVLLGRQFAVLQWGAVGVLTLSAMVARAPRLARISGQGDSSSMALGTFLLLVVTAAAGFSGVRNELIFKRRADNGCCDPTIKMPFMMQNTVLYVWGLVLNFVSWCIWGEHPFMEGVNGLAWVAITTAAIYGLMCAMMLKFLDNAVRCFAGMAQLLFTVVMSRVFPERFHVGAFDYFYVTSLVLLVAALVVYQEHESHRLPHMLVGAIVVSLVVGLICRFADPPAGDA